MDRIGDDHDAAGVHAPAARASGGAEGTPLYEVTLWPHRSLSRKGFRIVMAGAGAMLAFPVIPLVGTPAIWGLLPFVAGAWALLWLFIKRNYRDGRLREHLAIWPERIAVERREPGGKVLRWEANPYWVELKLHPDQRPENYLTLRGSGRTIQLGAFLSPEERQALHGELEDALMRARRAPRQGEGAGG